MAVGQLHQGASGTGRRFFGQHSRVWPPASLLGGLGVADRAALLALGSLCRYPVEATLMRQGGTDTHVVLLRSGKVKVNAVSETGDVTLLAVRVPGDVVGELAATGCGPRSATVTACTLVTGSRITEEDFQAFLARHPSAALALTRMVGRGLVGANERRVEFASYPVKVRLARVLAEFGREHGHRTEGGIQIDVRLTQTELAGITGAKTAAIQKAFRELREDGLVGTIYGRVTILRPTELELVAGSPAATTPA